MQKVQCLKTNHYILTTRGRAYFLIKGCSVCVTQFPQVRKPEIDCSPFGSD